MSSELSYFFKIISEEKSKIKEEKEDEERYISEFIDADSLVEELFGSKKQKESGEIIKDDKPRESTGVERYLYEGLLNNEPQEKTPDPLTPLNQNYATLEDLQNHYKLFINRIQQQLSTLGGGGEVRLEFLDDIDRSSTKINGKYLKYDSSSGKWIGDDASSRTYATTSVTTSSYTATTNDYYIGVNYEGAVTITLPSATDGMKIVIKDERGESSQGSNRYITILPSGLDSIDGQTSAILTYDYGSLTFIYRNGWRII